MLGMAPRQQGHNVASPETAPNGGRVVAAIPDHTVRSLPRSPPLTMQRGNRIHQRQGFLRVVPVRTGQAHGEAVRRACHKSDGACSRAWPDRWDSDRFGHRRTPRGCNNCPRRRATNQSGHRARANPTAQSGSDPTRQPVANPASDASRSFPIRTRVPAGASAKGYRYEGRRQYLSGTRVPRRAVDHPVAVVEDSARTARQDPTTNLVAAWRSCVFTLPRRENNVSGLCYRLLAGSASGSACARKKTGGRCGSAHVESIAAAVNDAGRSCASLRRCC
jgi:hypothetical protein